MSARSDHRREDVSVASPATRSRRTRRPASRAGRPMSDVDDTGVVGLADRLWQAEVDGRRSSRSPEGRPDLTVAGRLRDPGHNVERRVAAGAVVRGRKVGLTSRPHAAAPRRRRARLRRAARRHVPRRGRRDRARAVAAAAGRGRDGVRHGDRPGRPRRHRRRRAHRHRRRAARRSRSWTAGSPTGGSGRRHRRRQRLVRPKVVLGGRITPVTARGPAPGRGAAATATGRRSRAAPARRRSATRLAASSLAGEQARLGSARGLRRGDIVLAGPLHRMVPVRPGRLLPGRVRPPRERDGAVRRRVRRERRGRTARPERPRAAHRPRHAGSPTPSSARGSTARPSPPFTAQAAVPRASRRPTRPRRWWSSTACRPASG